MKRRDRRESGMSFVEMALVLPLLLLIGVAVADFGRAFYWGITLSQAARAGTAYGAQSNAKAGDSAGIEQAVRREAQNLADPASTSVVGVSSSRICECTPGTPVICTTTALLSKQRRTSSSRCPRIRVPDDLSLRPAPAGS